MNGAIVPRRAGGARAHRLPLALLAPILTSCATTDSGVIEPPRPPLLDEVCAVWRPIGWSGRDTPETILDVKAGNAARQAFCAD